MIESNVKINRFTDLETGVVYMNSPNSMSTLERCLKAAQECIRDPRVVSKAGFPKRDEFDNAIAELADTDWPDGEPYHRAYARAFDSEDGRMLYAARERAALPEPITKAEAQELTAAERDIERCTREYMLDHPGVSFEKCLTRVLDERPNLYKRYLLDPGR